MNPCEPASGPGYRAIVCSRGKGNSYSDEDAAILDDFAKMLAAPCSIVEAHDSTRSWCATHGLSVPPGEASCRRKTFPGAHG